MLAGRVIRGALLIAAGLALATAGAAQARPYHPPRTPSGAPDLQGLWNYGALTRLERTPLATTLEVDDASAAALERAIAKAYADPAGDPLGQEASEWQDKPHLAKVGGRWRTSFLTEPTDGRLPYSEAGKRNLAAARGGVMRAFDGPEERSTSDRCLSPGWGAAGPPIVPARNSSHLQIAQAPDRVVIVSEIDHEVRNIRIGSTARSPFRQWMGDSIGRWEHGTLVVETRNFHPQESFRAPAFWMSPDAVVTERFTRVSPTQIRYAFSVDDPAAFTRVWKGEETFTASTDAVYEYACHEGNYSMAGMLAGARRDEAKRPSGGAK